jgi:N-methylhydantoinase B
VVLEPNQEVEIATPGGGGLGDPLERDPVAVREDIADGLVSVEEAGQRYGVVITQNHEIDRAATDRRRRGG